MNSSFENKVALVTGAASGMGLATAKAFAEAGAAVALADVNEAGVRSAAEDLVAAGHKANGIRCDVADEAEVAAMVEQTVSTFGRLDAAFNNAGIQSPAVETADVSGDVFDRINAINLRGVWSCMKYELLQMREQGSGAIVNCSSLGGLVGVSGRAAYHAAKHGVLGLTKSAALEYAARGIRINAVCPGIIDTPMVAGMLTTQAEAMKELMNEVPIGRQAIRGAVLYGPRDIRFEERDAPTILQPTDAIIRISATCVCGSDLWPYRGISPVAGPSPMGHEYCGIVDEVGSAVTSVKPGQFVIGSFFASDNTCPNCQAGVQWSCQHKEFVTTAQAPILRVPLADGTLVATPELPSEDLVPSLLALSDVMGTGWFAAEAANVKPDSTVAVVGDGAVGLLGILSAKQMGAARIIVMSRHESRQKVAREFGATDIVAERGDDAVARIKDLTSGIGADAVLECVGTQESMMQAIHSARKGGYVSYVGVPHGVELDGENLFYAHVHLHGGPAPVRRFLPNLIDLVINGTINPGKVFDLTLPLEQVAEGYRAMDERRAIKTLLRP